jgi:hypothetical protein
MVLQLSARPWIVSDKPKQEGSGAGIQALVDEPPRMARAGNLMSLPGRYCSLIPGLGVKLSTIILAGLTVLSAVGACLRMMA